MNETCTTCHFARAANNGDTLECRQRSPQPFINSLASAAPVRAWWPMVERTDWCGSYQQGHVSPIAEAKP